MKTKFLTFILLFFSFFSLIAQSLKETSLNNKWKFKSVDSSIWLDATVPGCIHTDLLANKKIEDPFYRLNEHNQQWIDKLDWEYKTSFVVTADEINKENAEIVFYGLDTWADVYLNNKFLFSANNMFRTWKINVKKYIKSGENNLHIVFKSPIHIGIKKYDSLGYLIPVSDNDLAQIGGVGNKKVSVFSRKAGYHFGWDWGPRFVTSGIWRPIVLRTWDKLTINDIQIIQVDLNKEKAELKANIETESNNEQTAEIILLVNNKPLSQQTVKITKGNNHHIIPFNIEKPQLWWPNGLGEHYQYTIEIKIVSGSTILAKKNTKTGLRKLEIIQDRDSAGKSFYVSINGVPVFMKGANYIPQDIFLPRVTPEQYKYIIKSAVDANMNMLRVWGGGVYQDDIFYDLCDENGILVWQDFMFACAMFPGDNSFIENVRKEAIDNVKRLRNHPSIALWCGNNEIISAWYIWGWKKKYEDTIGKAIADTIWKSYESIFHKTLPEVVNELDPQRLYWSSSPSAEQGKPEIGVAGDVHYWGVWWAKEPFSYFSQKTGRFMSEYGFQSFPELSTVKKYSIPQDWDIFSDVMKSHQRSSIGNGTIEYYMLKDYKKPKDFPMFLYVNHLLQAEGIKVAMESHRKKMPYCMGSLFWQIDDCWPVASWSSIDYFGKWKAQQYFAVKAYAPILVSPEINNNKVNIFVVSDKLENINTSLKLTLMDLDGNILWNKSKPLTILANSSKIYFSFDLSEVKDTNNSLLNVQLIDNTSKLISDNQLFFTSLKNINFPEVSIKSIVQEMPNGYKITLNTNKPSKNVYLTIENVDGFFSDNYFNLIPGLPKEIIFTTKNKIENVPSKLKIITLRDSY